MGGCHSPAELALADHCRGPGNVDRAANGCARWPRCLLRAEEDRVGRSRLSRDLSGQQISDADLPFERPKEASKRVWLTDEEFAKRLRGSTKVRCRGRLQRQPRCEGTSALLQWVRTEPRRSPHLADRQPGRRPPAAAHASAPRRCPRQGKSSWIKGQPIDWVSRSRHIRPLHHARLPERPCCRRRYNNAVRDVPGAGLRAFSARNP